MKKEGRTKMDEVKPCPFCGGKALADCNYGKHGFFVFVSCQVCGARSKCFAASNLKPNEFWEQAIKAWNRRTDDGRKENVHPEDH